MNRRELETHLQDLFDGYIDPESFSCLQEEMRANPEAREAYREYLYLNHSLRFRAKGMDQARVVPMELVVERRQRRLMKQAGIAAAALLLIGVMVMSLVLFKSEKATLSFTTSLGTDVVVSHRLDGEDLPEGQTLEPGSRLTLKSGVVELEFASGVRGIVSGPAELTLLREDLVDLSHGAAWFHVPKKAVGFQVRTPDLVLTDLGTKFGVLSKPDILDEVHVFTGQVEAVNCKGLKEKEVIEAGQARITESSGGWRITELRKDHFLTERPENVPVSIELDDSATFTACPQNQMIRRKSYKFDSRNELLGFDPSESDKLVVTLSHERSEILEVTYGGVRMSLAVKSDAAEIRQTAIYYLDSPGVAGDLVVVFKDNSSANGVGGSLLALSNTANGKPSVVAQSSSRSVKVTTRVENSIVVASHVSNDHVSDAESTAQAPMTSLFGAPVGSAVGSSGYILVEAPSTVLPVFSGTGGEPISVGVALAPRP